MMFLNALGFAAATLTTVSAMPQIRKIWKTKSTKDISLTTYILLSTGILLWLLYGVAIGSLPLVFANSLSLALSSSVLFLKIRLG